MERTNSLAIAIAPIEAMRSLIEDRKDPHSEDRQHL